MKLDNDAATPSPPQPVQSELDELHFEVLFRRGMLRDVVENLVKERLAFFDGLTVRIDTAAQASFDAPAPQQAHEPPERKLLQHAQVIPVGGAFTVSIGSLGIRIFGAEADANACRDAINRAINGAAPQQVSEPEKSLSQLLNELLLFGVEDLARANGSMDAGEQRRLADYIGKKIGEIRAAAPPFCPVHQRLEDIGTLEVEISNNCVACSLHERTELLKLLAPFAPDDRSKDSLTVLSELIANVRASRPVGEQEYEIIKCPACTMTVARVPAAPPNDDDWG